MATVAQITANQMNSKLSTGPRTSEGKERASSNATRHSWSSTKLLIPGENPAEFEQTQAAMLARYSPANDYEAELTGRVIHAWWRLRRMQRFESELFNHCIATFEAENPGCEPGALLFADDRGVKRMNLFLRYMSNAQRDYKNAVAELDSVQTERKKSAQEHSTVTRTAAPARETLASFGETPNLMTANADPATRIRADAADSMEQS